MDSSIELIFPAGYQIKLAEKTTGKHANWVDNANDSGGLKEHIEARQSGL